MRYRRLAACALVLAVSVVATSAQAHDRTVEQKLQQTIDDYVAQRGKIEGVSGVALQIDLGEHRPTIALFAGNDGLSNAKPLDDHTLFQIGSNTKHFTAALVLKLEAMGKLNIEQTVGDWLPQYSAWKDVKIRSLLNMTAPIPNYLETEEIGKIVASDLNHQFSYEDLIGAVDPDNGKHFPTPTGWFYSNTNNILAAMIIEAASGQSYKDALKTMLLEPHHLHDTFYSDGAYRPRVLDRLPRGLYENPDCLLYQPQPCTKSTLAPLIGQDMRTENMSWAGPAGGMVSNTHDLDRWIRDLFNLRVFPQTQVDEMTSLVSVKTGHPITDVDADEPAAFGLDLGRIFQPKFGGAFWYYQGTTLGFRTIFAYWPKYDLVITTSTNSQAPGSEDKFIFNVVGESFLVLKDRGLLDQSK